MANYTERAKQSQFVEWLNDNAQVLSIALFFVACMGFFWALTDTFMTTGNLLNVVRQGAPVLIVAVAMTFVIMTAGIDLAVGSIVALINALAAILMANGFDWVTTSLMMVAAGAIVGLAQGWFISFQGIAAFIVTLAGMSILRGIALYITEGYSIPIKDQPGFFWLGRGTLAGIPVPAILAVLIAILGFIIMRNTRYGRQVVAVGSNLEAARRVGMPARWIVCSVYMASGIACAIAGLLIASRLGSGSSNAAVGFEMQVIAAVVLGGTSLMGGRGSILGTTLGALTILIIGNGLILMHVSPFLTQIVTGVIILLAVWMNTRLFGSGFKLGKKG
ncbi:ABC transporter permease [Paracoccus aminophilus]|uniref:Ribose/xylose/arabinose/galactoside ABC-type transport systems, permease component n=1 Tax=Paracoccus aminophilus JCM 7686 TaxID=1367847 RepID=S5Z016_PARAH|nr:ABC transporter permease [Paracoccus aminophilus]AGT10801.1 ribose/xylose/arabinose/galactoside ABC-type transport systems, permease component [Paracoccus aminophilus JCM 7686]